MSEILSGKRTLTVEMMRALESGLGIPAWASPLLGQPTQDENSQYRNWDRWLLQEMEERGYFGKLSLKLLDSAELVRRFFEPVCSPAQLFGMLRQSSYRSSPRTDRRALAAWAGAVLKKAEKTKVPTKYKKGTVNMDFMRELATLSVNSNGPLLGKEFLRKNGIRVVIEKHFSKTYLDGASILINRDNPVIGLTLRYDRLDNFWFTLMHELAHISLHYDQDIKLFYDELEGVKGVTINEKGQEADRMAQEALLPENKWEVKSGSIDSFVHGRSESRRRNGSASRHYCWSNAIQREGIRLFKQNCE